MFWVHGGVTQSRYVGITWDGVNKAAAGIDHAAKSFETVVVHLHEAFMNFTDAGIRIGQQDKNDHEQRPQSAELEYTNCLFENCGRGVAYVMFNDYDNTFDICSRLPF
jgi:hypothetical protein